MNPSLAIGFVAGLITGIILTGYAKASEVTQLAPERIAPIADHVTVILADLGYKVSPSPAPPAHSTRLSGMHGMTIDGEIVVNSAAPDGCFARIVAHELAHLILARDLGLTPAQTEAEAQAIELVIDPAYRPNCE